VVFTQSPLKGSDAIDGDEVTIMLTRNLNQKLQEMVETRKSYAPSEEIIEVESNNQDSIDDEWF
jgi:hypothetical protein